MEDLHNRDTFKNGHLRRNSPYPHSIGKYCNVCARTSFRCHMPPSSGLSRGAGGGGQPPQPTDVV